MQCKCASCAWARSHLFTYKCVGKGARAHTHHRLLFIVYGFFINFYFVHTTLPLNALFREQNSDLVCKSSVVLLTEPMMICVFCLAHWFNGLWYSMVIKKNCDQRKKHTLKIHWPLAMRPRKCKHVGIWIFNGKPKWTEEKKRHVAASVCCRTRHFFERKTAAA